MLGNADSHFLPQTSLGDTFMEWYKTQKISFYLETTFALCTSMLVSICIIAGMFQRHTNT